MAGSWPCAPESEGLCFNLGVDSEYCPCWVDRAARASRESQYVSISNQTHHRQETAPVNLNFFREETLMKHVEP